MWRAFLLTCAVSLVSATAHAAPRVELLTFGPGDDVFSRFGHTALRVRYEDGRDLVYSFGYAPFGQPSFIYRYLRGEAQFGVGVRTWQDTLARYRADNRTVVRQPLALGEERAAQLAGALEAYLEPGRNRYTYDQLRDNCATRVRDLIDVAAYGALRRATGGLTGHTYRDHTLRAAAGRPLLSFILDFIGGPNQETPLDGYSQLYLPRYLHDAVARAQIRGRPLAPQSEVVLQRRGPPSTAGPTHVGRYGWLGISFGVAIAVFAALRRRRGLLPAGVALFAYGLFTTANALILDVLVIISRVPDFAWNENVLAWLPTDAVLCVFGWRMARRQPDWAPRDWLVRYAQARVGWACVLVLLTVAGVLPQQNIAFIVSPALVFAALARSGRSAASEGL